MSQISTDLSGLTTTGSDIVIPLPRQGNNEMLAAQQHLTRILTLAREHGELLALPSPVRAEQVLAVYHLPRQGAGRQGDHVDARLVRAALSWRLVELGDCRIRVTPNGDLHELVAITLTHRGTSWLDDHFVCGLQPELRRLDRRSHAPAYPRWSSASWQTS